MYLQEVHYTHWDFDESVHGDLRIIHLHWKIIVMQDRRQDGGPDGGNIIKMFRILFSITSSNKCESHYAYRQKKIQNVSKVFLLMVHSELSSVIECWTSLLSQLDGENILVKQGDV